MNTQVSRLTFMMVLILCAITSLSDGPSSLAPSTRSISPPSATTSDSSPFENTLQTGAATAENSFGLILGNFLILCLYSFPMSFAENWAISDPQKDKKQSKTESSELLAATETPGKTALTSEGEAPTALDDRKTQSVHPSSWLLGLPRVPAGLAAGGFVMIIAVVLGAVGFALFYISSGQPEKVSEIIPRFAYWFPFAFLGMVTDLPFNFKMFDWENKRLRIFLRLIVWWFPRVIIVAFMFNLPIVRGLDPVTTALVVLAIDGVILAIDLMLYFSRKQAGIQAV